MIPLRCVFRVDSSLQIGSGHVMRCLSLAGGLREIGAVCIFVCRALEGNLNGFIISEGFNLIELPKKKNHNRLPDNNEPAHAFWREVDWQVDANETLACMDGLNADWLIVDHYGLWEDWHFEVSSSQIKIMVIDDLCDRRHHCDLLLDQNLGANISLYKDIIPKDSRVFFGPKYALLRPEFSQYRDTSLARRKKNKVDNIVINFGGGDPDNYIARTLTALLAVDIPDNVTISIIFGNLALVKQEHRRLIASFLINVEVFGAVRNMAQMLTNCDLVIGAAGSSAWERCCLGVPSIVFPVALNQADIAKKLSAFGAAYVLDCQDLSNGKFGALVSRIFESEDLKIMSLKASNICDGMGVEKIVNELKA